MPHDDDTLMTSEDQKTYMKVTFNEKRPMAPPTSSERSYYHKIAGYIKVCITMVVFIFKFVILDIISALIGT